MCESRVSSYILPSRSHLQGVAFDSGLLSAHKKSAKVIKGHLEGSIAPSPPIYRRIMVSGRSQAKIKMKDRDKYSNLQANNH